MDMLLRKGDSMRNINLYQSNVKTISCYAFYCQIYPWKWPTLTPWYHAMLDSISMLTAWLRYCPVLVLDRGFHFHFRVPCPENDRPDQPSAGARQLPDSLHGSVGQLSWWQLRWQLDITVLWCVMWTELDLFEYVCDLLEWWNTSNRFQSKNICKTS